MITNHDEASLFNQIFIIKSDVSHLQLSKDGYMSENDEI